jgi:NAD(P)-dependent dehydrogenase (short-subunit alcohol dehydrogenase family)
MAVKGTAVVTGAGTGIGRGAALALLADGWNVGLAGRRPEPLAETAALAAPAAGAEAMPLAADVTDEREVDRLFDAAAERFGRIDLLFNNAGRGFAAATVDAMPVAAWREVVDVNLTGSFLCARAAFRRMRGQDPQGGRIVNNGSISAHAPRPGSAAYTATKHAVTGLTKSLALDGRPFNIACGQIDIGNALTEMAQPMTRGVPQADGRIAVEPVMDVARVAEAVVFMANMPLDSNVLFMTVMATGMPFVGRG